MANMTDKEAKERGKEVQDAINDLIAEGKLPEIKSMTRAQRRELDAKKLNYFKGVYPLGKALSCSRKDALTGFWTMYIRTLTLIICRITSAITLARWFSRLHIRIS